ncbi:MAG TPA: SPFH domain-containing protein [Arachnia sp.]|nr:SPFH domain-containing protein [Arachnia sp.]HMT87864.1 SPFH domain-containing protein [Arachnia sp.]
MFAIVFIALFAIIAVVAAAAAAKAERRSAPLLVAGIALLLAMGIAAATTMTIVPTRQVGVPVTFGKPGTPVSNGLHFTAPWTNMVLMDATIQSLDATGESATIAKDIDRSDVFVHNNVRWSIQEQEAASLYRDYISFEAVGDALVQPALRTAVAGVMSTYDPLGSDQPGNAELAEQVKDELQSAVGDRVVIHSVSITLLDFSEATRDRINALNTERGNTRIAEQRAVTAAKDAEANRILSESVGGTEGVLVARCLDLIGEGKPLPAGFQCWPGQATTVGVIAGS